MLVAAPTRRDGETSELLGKEGVECIVCVSFGASLDELKYEAGGNRA